MSQDSPPPNKADSIAQIQGLGLPERGFERRTVYVGENIFAWLKGPTGAQIKVPVIDISIHGMAVLLKKKVAEQFAKGDQIQVGFARSSLKGYQLEAELANSSELKIHSEPQVRVGLRFKANVLDDLEDFSAALADREIPLRSYIRPQVSSEDPFFYNETTLYQVVSITSRGMVLVVVNEGQTLLPGQPMGLEVYVPGKGVFFAPAHNSDLFCVTGERHLRIYVVFDKPPPGLLEALSEHLVAVGGLSPVALREAGFKVGAVEATMTLDYGTSDEAVNLRPTLLGFTPSDDKQAEHMRVVNARLGPLHAVQVTLLFVDGHKERSSLAKQDHKLDAGLVKGRHLEIIGMQISDQVALIDVLIPLLRQVVRIAYQSGMGYIVVEARAPMVPVLEKLGFVSNLSVRKVEGESAQADDRATLLSLAVGDILAGKSKLPTKLWAKLYRGLARYLKD